MGETVAGGAYLGTDGKTWHDANGKLLEKGRPAGLIAAGAAERGETGFETQEPASSSRKVTPANPCG